MERRMALSLVGLVKLYHVRAAMQEERKEA